MHYESIQTLVIGGGVIGLAVARTLALSSRQVVLVEKEKYLIWLRKKKLSKTTT